MKKKIACSRHFLLTNSFCFCMSEKVFICFHFLEVIFAGYRIVGYFRDVLL